MKINLNALGYGEKKWIYVSESLIGGGLALATLGLVIMRKTQCWTYGANKEAREFMSWVADTLDERSEPGMD